MVVKNKNREEGQAIFEFVIFLPFLIFLYTIMYNVGNAINGSINQQKATRRYYFHFIKGNSMIPNRDDLDIYIQREIRTAGMSGLGWRENGGEADDGEAFGTCYKFGSFFLGGDRSETCREVEQGVAQSKFIRIYTYFGVCGETYTVPPGGNYYISDFSSGLKNDPQGCTNSSN
jgi:hypothetical protein